MRGRFSPRVWLALILLVYGVLTVGYGVVNPLFEAPDEQMHYFTVQTVAETGRLPFVAPEPAEPDPWMGQEAAQPPLYYVLGAVLVRPVDTAQARELVWFNPYVRLGDADSPTNINAFVHTPAEGWPWEGYVLAAHLLRLFSTVIGAGTLLFIYGSGRLVWPERPGRALLATGLVAVLPQYGFLHGAISNDPLIILFCAAGLWQLLRLWLRGVTAGRLLLLGVTAGLAILSKMAGLLLLAYAGVWLVLLAMRRGEGLLSPATVRRVAGYVLMVFVPAGLLGGWLLVRNWLLYEDVTATSQFIRIAGGDRGYSLWQVLGETGGLWRSFFAVFGWMNVVVPPWVYGVWEGIVILGVVGAVWQVAGGRGQGAGGKWEVVPGVLLAVWPVVVYAGLVQFLLRTPAAQGRLMFPALVPLALGLAYGLSYLRREIWLALWGLGLATSVYALAVVIPAAYAPPPVIEEAEIPAGAERLDMAAGFGLELVAVEMETVAARPGEVVWLTLYWRAEERPEEAPEVVVELFGREWALVGKLQTYHGGGLYPANLWPAGGLVADRVGVEVAEGMDVPVAAAVQVRLVDGAEPRIVGAVKVRPEEWPADAGEALAQLGEGIELLASEVVEEVARPGERVTVRVRWRVTAAPGRALTTFVHLGEPTEPPLATGDDQPLSGFYPTQYWAAGEVFADAYTLVLPGDLPAGRYPVWLGMYDGAGRVALVVAGERVVNDAFLVGEVEVR